MGIFTSFLSNDKLVEGVAKAGKQAQATLLGKQREEAPDNEGYFFKNWTQEFWGAKTLDECDLMEFQYKSEAVRIMLELITDEDGFVDSKRRRVLMDYCHECGFELLMGVDPEGELDFAFELANDTLNVLDMAELAPYNFAVCYYGSAACMTYTAEQRIRGDRKKVIYKMQMTDLSKTRVALLTKDVDAVFSAAGKERSKRARKKRDALRQKIDEERKAREAAALAAAQKKRSKSK